MAYVVFIKENREHMLYLSILIKTCTLAAKKHYNVLILFSGIVLVAAVSKCPKDWAEFNNECLFFSYDRRNWLDSQVMK